ncbi:MAG TPA: peptidylprolyl isomerase [Candidatus Eremiobacteraceae bacterium]|nr:peptidylprolyl isomerase [Candidatus Eremiobacteraceae bacterium]
MAGAFDNKKVGVRILFGIIIGLIALSMLLYLVPQGPQTGEASTDTLAKVGDQTVSVSDVRLQLSEIAKRNNIPKQLEGLYAQQILNQLVFQKEIEYEAKRLGISVSEKERADRIRQYLPTAYNGDTFVGMDQYAAQVQQRFQLTVPVFEELVRQGLLEEKFRKLVTDGVSAGPAELLDEFRYRNEKIKLDYALIKPEDLEAKIAPTEAEIKAAYEKDKSKYQIPEKRVVRYALADTMRLLRDTQISDEELNNAYKQNLQQFNVPNRVHVEHILLFTKGKTDAEVIEIRKKAEDVLKQAKKGAKFEDLAKKYSEDPGTKDKGGDLGWLTQGQTVKEFEQTAFGLPVGGTSDVVQTVYGFHIIKVLEKETAHTKTLAEVKDALRAPMVRQKADDQAAQTADKLSSAIRQSNKTSLDELAQKFNLTVAETRPVGPNDPLLELGNTPEVKNQVFRLRKGELSLPIKTDRGYVVLSIKDILPAHQGSLEESRDKIISQLKTEKAVQEAKSKADELARRVKAGEKFDAAAKALGLDPKSTDSFARNGSVSGIGNAKSLSAAFAMNVGDVGGPQTVGANWVVYRVAEKTPANPADFEKQKKEITDQVLQAKRGLAYDTFRTALEGRLKKEGKLQLMPEKMKNFTSFS